MSFYKFARTIVGFYMKPVFRMNVIGKENIPQEGPIIVCSNHISNWDPLVVGITCPRNIYFMAKEELFKNKLLSTLLRKVHAFPIKRGMKDRTALRNALDILKEGNALGLFPEGTRSKTGEVGDGLAGAGFFALRSEAQVVPCAIVGPYKKGKKLKVVYGTPIEMDPLRERKASAKEVTDIIMQEIRLLKQKNS
ncbi:1-acyl-sn-glycerol-3-phosphate acyltransferase [Paraliobacillus quinghaiensis]|uniref:1-acyl-sn-glycerol-3-phosphate acyltransferase n=1 Tax=Paraliobacillus quinghaiensis TaxID=470815 RepID=A0A917TH78_9BACI|nr:lysophospholipid acyltransferase family protein [Paraliobacillus quinghaiensis]GGM22766.1 1-acyl-sn-glycerol-3-phosphate acyltransferase [Paraliobacillus quinghaiensis]